MESHSSTEHPEHYRVMAVALFAFVVLLLCPPQSAVAQNSSGGSRPLIVVTQLTAPSGDAVAEKLSSTITGSIALVMRMTGSLLVERADFLAPSLSFDRALEYYHKVDAGGAVYGSVKPASGRGYAVELVVWNGEHPGAKPTVVRRTITNLLSSFTIADRLSLEVASTVVGRKLAEGTLAVKGLAGLSRYSIYADGHLLARNEPTLPVLTGRHEIVVAKPGALGDVPVEFFRVTIEQGTTTTVTLSKKVATAARQSAASVPVASKPATATPKSGSTSGLSGSAGTLTLRYAKSSGIFGHPSLTYGSRTYTLATKGEYAWAAALLSNLPGITPPIRSRLRDSERLLKQVNRRRTSFGVLSAVGLGGIGAAAYGLIKSSSIATNVGLMIGLASIAAAVPTRMLESDSSGRINADFSSAVKEYDALPASVRNRPPASSYFDFHTDFSGTQGANNWYYGYSGTSPHAPFQLMQDLHAAPWDGAPTWWIDYTTSWTYVGSGALQGASPKGSTSVPATDGIARFVVPADGVYAITVTFNRQFAKGTPSVSLELRKDGSPVWSRTMSRSDISTHVEQRTLTCRRGDTLDIVAGAYDQAAWQTIIMDATISRER